MEGLARRELLFGGGGGRELGFRQRKIIAAAGLAVQEKPLSSSSLRDGSAKDKSAVARKQHIDGPVAKQQQLKPKREGFALLEEFYEAMESSIALLRIRSQPCTFTAVSSAVESLTKRRFLRSHLAKIKHLFPEAVECDSFAWKDLDTASLKTDLRIKLKPFNPAGARVTKTASGIGRKFSADTTARRQEFRKRIACFEANFPEDDLPEAPLEENEESDELLNPSGSLRSAVLQGVTIKTEYQDILSRRAHKAEDEVLDEYVDPRQSVLPGNVVIKTGYQDIVERRGKTDDEVHMSHFPVGFRPFFAKKQQSRASGSSPTEAAIASTVIKAGPGEASGTASTPKQATQPQVFATPAPPVARRMKALENTAAAELRFATPCVPTPRQDTPQEPARVMATPELATPQQAFSDRETGSFVTPFSCSVEKQRQVPIFASPKTASGSDTKLTGVPSKRSVVKSLQFGKHPADDEAVCSRPDNKLDFEAARTSECDVVSPSEQQVRIAGSPSKPIARSPSKMIARSPSKMFTGSPSKMSPLKQQAGIIGSPSKRLLSPVASPSKRMLLESPRKRSLVQSPGTPAKQTAREAALDGAGQQILKSLPEELVQSVRQKEKKVLEDQRTNLAATQRRQQMIAGLPHLFNMTRSIYQSQGRSVMLHKDLLEKIASSSTEITDQAEIEERLKLLLELAPDWITSKASLSGEVMYRIQKNAEFPAIWRRLAYHSAPVTGSFTES